MGRWHRAGAAISLTAAVFLGSSCSEDGTVSLDFGTGDAGPDTVCPPTLKLQGGACVPVLDDCPDSHVPVPGGGCKRVGVAECGIDGIPGIVGPPDWTCKRIGVAECTTSDNGPGLRGPPDWTCKAIGPPTKCLAGWARISEGWCKPILPKARCPAGTMEVIGKSTCQPVGDCGTGTWGKIQLTPKTLFVDASYAASDADGSQAKPFPTVGQALKAAPRDAHVAVAEGEYEEDLVLDRALVLEGRCPAKVRIMGQDPKAAAITVLDTVTIRGLGISGAGRGIWIKAARALIEEVEVARCGDTGVEVQGASGIALRGANLMLRDSLVAKNHVDGIHIAGAAALVERSVVRDTWPSTLDKTLGRGVVAETWNKQPASLVLRDSLVAGNHCGGIKALGATAVVARSVVRDTGAQASDKGWGHGVDVRLFDGVPAGLQLTDSVVDNNRFIGVGVFDADATIQRSIVRNTQNGLQPTEKWEVGTGINVSNQSPRTLLVQDSLVVRNHHIGLAIFNGTDATVERSVVRDTLPTNKEAGVGIQSLSPLALRDSLVANNHAVGVAIAGAKAVVERSVVRDTKPRRSDKDLGSGVWVTPLSKQPASLELRDSLVANNRHIGVCVGGTAVLERSVVRDTQPKAADNSYGTGIQIEPVDGLPAGLQLTDCLLLNNRFIGVGAFDADLAVTGSIVKDTQLGLQRTAGFKVGTGINVSNNGNPRKLLVQDTLVTANHFVGIAIFDTPEPTVDRCVVRDTKPRDNGTGGMGIVVSPGKLSTSLTLSDSFIARNRVAGLLVTGSAKVRRCRVDGTLPGKADIIPGGASVPQTEDGWGDGILAAKEYGSPFKGALDLEDLLVASSARAGLLFQDATGTVHRSVLRKGAFSVVLDNANVELGDDNLFEDNTENRVTYEDLPQLAPIYLPPAPEPAD